MPDRLGRYAVRRRIGAGGFATVWLAYDEQLDAPVAIKVLADNWTEDHHVRTRFVEEGRFLRRVESPHVVTVYDAGELDDGRPYLVMTYADQGTLADRLQVGGLSVAQTVEVVRQVASGLQALHDRGVLHRDIKPANVLFRTIEGPSDTRELRAMVGDLGLGKALDMSSRLTMIAGTPSYVAPEQAMGESPDARADQYSLGVLTFLLLTGRTPYAHASLAAAATPGPPPSLSSSDRQLPAAVDDAVRRALAVDRDDRWPTVTAVRRGAGRLPGRLRRRGGAHRTPVAPARPGAHPARCRAVAQAGAAARCPTRPRRRRTARRVLGSRCGAGRPGGRRGGRLVHRRAPAVTREVMVEDETGQLEVTVPGDWDRAVADSGWQPPVDEGEEEVSFAALSVGTRSDWNQPDVAAEGVFVGLFAGHRAARR